MSRTSFLSAYTGKLLFHKLNLTNLLSLPIFQAITALLSASLCCVALTAPISAQLCEVLLLCTLCYPACTYLCHSFIILSLLIFLLLICEFFEARVSVFHLCPQSLAWGLAHRKLSISILLKGRGRKKERTQSC